MRYTPIYNKILSNIYNRARENPKTIWSKKEKVRVLGRVLITNYGWLCIVHITMKNMGHHSLGQFMSLETASFSGTFSYQGESTDVGSTFDLKCGASSGTSRINGLLK
ncbi:hypothetical protein BDB01DRAFT_833259 [Pilobolus umbonatus]|nr:hypothetical protein BDB01DRAFT_833259 [Pilobolus umbonatus]